MDWAKAFAAFFGRLEPKVDGTKVRPLVLAWISRAGRFEVRWGEEGRFDNSLFRNGVVCVRLARYGVLPFVGLMVRWSGSVVAKSYLQTYWGPKLNGEIAIAPRFRIQSDESAAGGTWGPNHGQAIAWEEGPK